MRNNDVQIYEYLSYHAKIYNLIYNNLGNLIFVICIQFLWYCTVDEQLMQSSE